MSTNLPTSTTSTSTLEAPTWATSKGAFCGESVLWSHKVELNAMEVDGPESMTVEAYLYDFLDLDEHGVSIRRDTPEIQITRHDEDEGFCGGPLRFEVADARKFAATIVALCDAVEGSKIEAAA